MASLKFIIVGGSIAGLAAAYALKKASRHEVCLLEASDGNPPMMKAVFRTVPNGTKLLKQLGLSPLLEKTSTVLNCLQYVDGETGEEVVSMTNVFLDAFTTDAVAECVSLPEKELRAALYELAKQEGVIFRFKTQAVDVEPASGVVTLANGERLSADIIIGADGFYSFIRKFVVEDEKSNACTMAALVSFSVSLDKILADETLQPLLLSPSWIFWMGDGFIGHSSVADREQNYSLTLEFVYQGCISPEDKHWREIGQSELGRFINFGKLEERLRKLIASSNQSFVKVFINKPQAESFVCPLSRCILVGDAAHRHVSGNWLANTLDLEDAHTLGSLFSRIQDRSKIGRFVTAYDDIRHARSSSLLEHIEKRRVLFMAPEGPLRELRNLNLKKFSELSSAGEISQGISFVMQHADDMVEDWWNKYGASLGERRRSVLSNVEVSVAKKIGDNIDI